MNHSTTFRSVALFLLLAFAAGSRQATAQTTASNPAATDEQTIRSLVQQSNEGKGPLKQADDRIFVSGPYKRPFIGQGTPESQRTSDSIRTARSNVVNKQTILRLEVAKSGDLAYEYGEGILEFDEKDNKHFKGNLSYLRVWKKVAGEWVVAAMFARPNRQ